MISERWDPAEALDMAVAARQLGRPLAGRVVAVAKRCSHGQPQVLVTYPLLHAAEHDGGDGSCGDCDSGVPMSSTWTPFPTVFWLTCPEVRSKVASLESRGMIEDIRCRLREDAQFRHDYEQANARYASQRMGLLDTADWARLRSDAKAGEPGANMLRVTAESGIGGAADWTGVKCLHMNVADYMAGNANPVGELCVQRLAREGKAPILECADGRCVAVRLLNR